MTEAGCSRTFPKQSGADIAIEAMSVTVGDYNLDGRFDVFVTNVGASVLLRGDGARSSRTSRPRQEPRSR